VIVDLPSLHRLDPLVRLPGGLPGRIGGDIGGAGPLDPEACRRLACDATVTRVVVSRQPPEAGARCHGGDPHDPTGSGLKGLLWAVLAKLPPILGGAPSRPLDVGRSSRVVTPAQRSALAVRDGGCVFPGCSRPLAWCEAHHVRHWLDGGPTDLDNLALVCRAHHREVHEGGWRLIRGPDGRFTAPHHTEDTGPPSSRCRSGRPTPIDPRPPARPTGPATRHAQQRWRPPPKAWTQLGRVHPPSQVLTGARTSWAKVSCR
jgi:hypothetical protein